MERKNASTDFDIVSSFIIKIINVLDFMWTELYLYMWLEYFMYFKGVNAFDMLEHLIGRVLASESYFFQQNI